MKIKLAKKRMMLYGPNEYKENGMLLSEVHTHRYIYWAHGSYHSYQSVMPGDSFIKLKVIYVN